MKHNLKITIILLVMFILTQMIGLVVVNYYLNEDNKIPYGFDQRDKIEDTNNFQVQFLTSLITSFIIALFIVFILMKIKAKWFMRAWFFFVIMIALGITLNPLISQISLFYPAIISIFLGFILAYFKIFRRNAIIHNLTELLIYPGIAAIFVSMLNLWAIIILLIIISIYDIWAVWHSGVMQKMAKYQMNEVGIFGGFLIPYAAKAMREKIKLLKMKYKNNIPENVVKRSKIKVSVAILGGGDIIFPIIAAGIVLKTFNVYAALCVSLFASLALLYLFVFAEKKKYYPAMPYLTAGIFLGMLIGWLVFVL